MRAFVTGGSGFLGRNELGYVPVISREQGLRELGAGQASVRA